MTNGFGSDISRNITNLYVVALSAIAFLSIFGQILVQKSLTSQLDDSKVINIAGRQRMLSQKITKTALVLSYNTNTASNALYLEEFGEALTTWRKIHNGLKNGYLDTIKRVVRNSDSLQMKFLQVQPFFDEIVISSNAIYNICLHYPSKALPIDTLVAHVLRLLSAERTYLKLMDSIVFQYQLEAIERVNYSKNIELTLLFIALVVLALEAMFVFKPAVDQIKNTIEKLYLSEKNTHLTNESLMKANKSLQDTRRALLEASNQKHRRELNRQKMRSAFLIEGQEEERKRIAREIHDGLGQMLTALKFGIEKFSDPRMDRATKEKDLVELQYLVSQVISETRTISFNLMPTVLSDFGVSSALKNLSTQAAALSGINIHYTTNMKSERLPKNIEVGLYRIGQEAINNAVKYSSAENINVNLYKKKKYIHFVISDNGNGFDYLEASGKMPGKTGGNGINNMKERAFMIDSEIKIHSYPGKGTAIHLKIPIQEHEEN